MKATGKTIITEDLTLQDPTLTISMVMYDWETNKVIIQVTFQEMPDGWKHSRNFEFDNKTGKELKTSDIYSYLSSHKSLKNFK